MATPIVCLAATLGSTIETLESFFLAAIDLMTLNWKQGGKDFGDAIDNAIDAVVYAICAAVDTLLQVIALATRSGATIVSEVSDGIDVVLGRERPISFP